jgi:hypothetical protein
MDEFGMKGCDSLHLFLSFTHAHLTMSLPFFFLPDGSKPAICLRATPVLTFALQTSEQVVSSTLTATKTGSGCGAMALRWVKIRKI